MTDQLTIRQLHILLGELIADGYGDREFQLFYDSETVYTTIPKGSAITVMSKSIRFTDYDDGKCHLDDDVMEMIK